MLSIVVITLTPFLILLYLVKLKSIFYEDREGKKKIEATFEKYESVTEKVSRNEYATRRYGYVRINNNEGSSILARLNSASFLEKEFRRGEKLDVFWSNNRLLYWHTYDIGLMKYFPSKSTFTKKKRINN